MDIGCDSDMKNMIVGYYLYWVHCRRDSNGVLSGKNAFNSSLA